MRIKCRLSIPITLLIIVVIIVLLGIISGNAVEPDIQTTYYHYSEEQTAQTEVRNTILISSIVGFMISAIITGIQLNKYKDI